MTRLSAHDVIALLADPASWQSWDRPPTQVAADSQYAEDLACARAKTGLERVCQRFWVGCLMVEP
jgi:acyl-CoA carboxylase subunit beta